MPSVIPSPSCRRGGRSLLWRSRWRVQGASARRKGVCVCVCVCVPRKESCCLANSTTGCGVPFTPVPVMVTRRCAGSRHTRKGEPDEPTSGLRAKPSLWSGTLRATRLKHMFPGLADRRDAVGQDDVGDAALRHRELQREHALVPRPLRDVAAVFGPHRIERLQVLRADREAPPPGMLRLVFEPGRMAELPRAEIAGHQSPRPNTTMSSSLTESQKSR